MLSASQNNAESLLAIGDLYYYQIGDKVEAAYMYQRAADHRLSHASFNLGIMHEIGDGVPQDFHLAKRFYDQAAEIDVKAKTARDVALLLLETHKSLYSMLGRDATNQLVSDFVVTVKEVSVEMSVLVVLSGLFAFVLYWKKFRNRGREN